MDCSQTGRWGAARLWRRWREQVKGDERTQGDGDFVVAVLSEQNERLEVRYRLQSKEYDVRGAFPRVAALSGLEMD